MDDPVAGLRVHFSLPPAATKGAVARATSSELREHCQPPPSSLLMTKEQFVESMVNLTLMKRTTEFSKPELSAWYAVLSGFPWKVLNRAVIEAALSAEKFPDLGDLVRACERHMPQKPYSPNGGDEKWRPAKSLVESIGRNMGLDV